MYSQSKIFDVRHFLPSQTHLISSSTSRFPSQDSEDLNIGTFVEIPTPSASITRGGEVTPQEINDFAGECLRIPFQPLNQDNNSSLNVILHHQVLMNIIILETL